MNRGLLYLDSSAIVKLVVREPETRALFSLLREWPNRVSSALATVEVLRALHRARAGGSAQKRAVRILDGLALIRVDEGVLRAAAALDPPELRSLDAIHLATTLSIRGDLAAIVTYDSRLAKAALDQRLDVWAPA